MHRGNAPDEMQSNCHLTHKDVFYIVMSFRESCFQQLTLAFKITSLYCIKKVLIYPIIVQSGLPQNEISLLQFLTLESVLIVATSLSNKTTNVFAVNKFHHIHM